VRPTGRRWLLAGLAAAQALIWLAFFSLVYPNRPELPLGALLALALLLAAARAARDHIHAGLRGLRRPLPRDGLDLIEREQRAARLSARAWLAGRVQPLWPLLPAVLLIAGLMLAAPARALGLALLALVAFAPLLLVPFRWLWLLPLWLALPLSVLLAQAQALGAARPPGWWTQPLAATTCSGLVQVAGDPPRAWCLETGAGRATAFDPALGTLVQREAVPEAARLFAAAGGLAWVQQNPASGLVRLGPAGPQRVRVLSAQVGAAEANGRLWVIDAGQVLTIYAPDGTATRLLSRDGLLNNTANVVRVSPAGAVWVGSLSGLSVLRAGATAWQTLDRNAGAPGNVQAIAFGPDETVWVLWLAPPHTATLQAWGLSTLHPGGAWTHRAVGDEVQLGFSPSEDPLAIDGRGGAWVVTHQAHPPQRVLVHAPASQPAQRYPLGPDTPTNALWRDPFGVVPDGTGGIYLYIGDDGWWRWRP
jgi:sugar lactone lactonase YvrE